MAIRRLILNLFCIEELCNDHIVQRTAGSLGHRLHLFGSRRLIDRKYLTDRFETPLFSDPLKQVRKCTFLFQSAARYHHRESQAER